MTYKSISLRLNEAGSRPSETGLPRLTYRFMNDIHILSIDGGTRNPIRGRPFGNICDRCRAVDPGVLPIQVVLTNKEDGELPDARQIERLMKGSDVGRTITKHCNS